VAWKSRANDTFWHQAVFSTPINTPLDKLMEAVPRYITKFVRARDEQGWHLISRVLFNPSSRLIEPDRRQYTLWACFERKPEVKTIEVPDNEKLINRLIEKYGARLQS